MANGGSTWVVKVVWQAIPDSLNYFDLSEADRQAVDQKLVAEVNSRVPLADQAKWSHLAFVVATFDELAAKVGSLLQLEAKPPAGAMLAITETMTLWLPRPPFGHEIAAAVMLKDTGGTALHPWQFSVNHNNSTYSARMGLTYECSHARTP